MRAGRYKDALLLGHQGAAPEPGGSRLLVDAAAAEALVAQQPDEIARNLGETLAHAEHEVGVGRLRRQVHGKVDDIALVASARAASHLSGADEGALADPGVDETATLRLDIAPGNGGEIYGEPLGQRALRRQPVPVCQTPALHIVGDDVGDREVARLGIVGKVGKPVVHEHAFSEPRSKNHSTN